MPDEQENPQETAATAESAQPAAEEATSSPEEGAEPATGAPSEQKDEKIVRKYDFRRPQHLSADQMKEIQRVHVSAAAELAIGLARYFNAELEIRLEKAEELNYLLLIESLPEYTYANVLDVSPLKDKGLLLLDSPLCLALVDRVLGGAGTAAPEARALTAVDEAAVESPIQIILRSLQSAWSDFCAITMTIAERRNDVHHVQLHGPGEVMLVATLAASGDLGEGRIRICLPIASLKSAMDSAAQRAFAQQVSAEKAPVLRAALARSLGEVTLPLTAAIGKGDASIRNLINLHPGDILRIDRQAAEPIVLQVDGRPTFLARMGLQGRKKAVQIVERCHTT